MSQVTNLAFFRVRRGQSEALGAAIWSLGEALGAFDCAGPPGHRNRIRREFMSIRSFDLVKGMKMRTKSTSALLLATITIALAAVMPATSYNDTIKTNFSHPISNVRGKSLVAVEVSYPPGGASAPHHHSDSAFIYAYVVSGQIASQVKGQPEHIYRAGECWSETPGAHHLISRNASNTEPAKLLAVFVVDTGDNALTTPDPAGGSR
jgi:quercetin dioxygenase-like cupin family protein